MDEINSFCTTNIFLKFRIWMPCLPNIYALLITQWKKYLLWISHTYISQLISILRFLYLDVPRTPTYIQYIYAILHLQFIAVCTISWKNIKLKMRRRYCVYFLSCYHELYSSQAIPNRVFWARYILRGIFFKCH